MNKLNRKEVIILLVGVVFFIGWCTGNQTEEIGSEAIEVTTAKRKPARTPDEIVADLYEDAKAKETPNERKARAEAKRGYIEAVGAYAGYNSYGKHFVIHLSDQNGVREFMIQTSADENRKFGYSENRSFGHWFREDNRIEMVIDENTGWYYELTEKGLQSGATIFVKIGDKSNRSMW